MAHHYCVGYLLPLGSIGLTPLQSLGRIPPSVLLVWLLVFPVVTLFSIYS